MRFPPARTPKGLTSKHLAINIGIELLQPSPVHMHTSIVAALSRRPRRLRGRALHLSACHPHCTAPTKGNGALQYSKQQYGFQMDAILRFVHSLAHARADTCVRQQLWCMQYQSVSKG
jgi:hypothetical protein